MASSGDESVNGAVIGASLSPTHPQGVFAGISPVTLILYRTPRFHFSARGENGGLQEEAKLG